MFDANNFYVFDHLVLCAGRGEADMNDIFWQIIFQERVCQYVPFYQRQKQKKKNKTSPLQINWTARSD